MSESKQTPIQDAQRLLAEIEADVREGHDKLHQLQTAGAQHFRERLEWAHKRGINPGNVDAWCREASGVAKVTK